MNQTREIGDMSLFDLNKSENHSFDYKEQKQRKTIGVQITQKFSQSKTQNIKELDDEFRKKRSSKALNKVNPVLNDSMSFSRDGSVNNKTNTSI